MSLENASYIHQLNPANPSGADRVKDGDDHLRMLKTALKNTFPGITGPLSPSVTHTFLNGLAALLVPVGAIMLWSGTEAAVPAGWAICDGRTVAKSDGSSTITTPNFQDRVPVGVASGRPVGTAFGQYVKGYTSSVDGYHGHTASTGAAGSHNHGGATQAHTLDLSQIPSHRHYVVAAGTGDNRTRVNTTLRLAAEKTSDGDSQYTLIGTGSEATYGQSSPEGGSQGHAHVINTDGAHTHPVYVDAAGQHSHTITIDTSQPALSVYFIMKV